jgi:hypothetical protein
VPSNLLGLFTRHQTTTQVKKTIWDTQPTPNHSETRAAASGKTKRRAKCGDMSKHMHWETGVVAKKRHEEAFTSFYSWVSSFARSWRMSLLFFFPSVSPIFSFLSVSSAAAAEMQMRATTFISFPSLSDCRLASLFSVHD